MQGCLGYVNDAGFYLVSFGESILAAVFRMGWKGYCSSSGTMMVVLTKVLSGRWRMGIKWH
jgi:hypothetical protein